MIAMKQTWTMTRRRINFRLTQTAIGNFRSTLTKKVLPRCLGRMGILSPIQKMVLCLFIKICHLIHHRLSIQVTRLLMVLAKAGLTIRQTRQSARAYEEKGAKYDEKTDFKGQNESKRPFKNFLAPQITKIA